MKYALILSIAAALLGGCAIVPAGYGDNRYGYSQGRDYNRGDGYYRDREYYRSNANDRDSYYMRRNGDPFQEHGH
jgi:hypothetical protein